MDHNNHNESEESNLKSSIKYTHNDFVKELMCSGSPAPLVNITLPIIAVSLWLRDDVRSEIANSCKFYNPYKLKYELNECRNRWAKIKTNVLKYIPNITIPKTLSKSLEKSIQLVGDQILNFLNYRLRLDAKKINIYLDNLKWTSQGMIDKGKTNLLLLEHEDLNATEKYELACSICSEEKISYYLPKLPEQFINKFIEVKKFRLMVYWTLHLKGDQQRFIEIQKRDKDSESSVIKFMFEWSFDNNNEVAARYFMNKCLDNSIRDNLWSRTEISINDGFTLLFPYLMPHMEPNEFQALYINKGYIILNRLANDWRLKSYFASSARYVLQFITEMNLLEAFKIILLCWTENVLDEQKCKDLLHEFVHRVKENDEPTFTFICHILLGPLFSLGSFETFKLLLTKCCYSVKSEIIYSTFGLKLCWDLTLKGKCSDVEIFINEMLYMIDDIRLFKSSFFQDYSFELSLTLATLSNYHILDNFVKLFSNDEQIKKFKLELPYKFRATIISNIFKCSSYLCSEQLKAIDEFLNWCFEGDALKMSNCISEVFEIDSKYKELQEQFFQQIFELIIKGELQLLYTYLNWTYRTSEKLLKFKSKFFENNNFEICCYLITDDKYKLLDEFLNIFCVKNEISAYKNTLPFEREGNIIKELLKMRNPADVIESIMKFFNYSFDENEKVITYLKSKIIIDQGEEIDDNFREIFLKKIPILMKSKKLLDKYMK